MIENSVDVKKNLRDLAKHAYEEELKKYITPLYEKFKEWESGELTSLNLAGFIHRFHNGISKKLFRIYSNLDSSLLVARAIALKILPEESIDSETLHELSGKIAFYQTQKDELLEDELDYEY